MSNLENEALRIGVVPYLNVQPLIWSLSRRPGGADQPVNRIDSAPPRILADRLSHGEFDVAIVPVMEYLLRPQYSIVPGVSIGSNGPVRSVAIFSSVPLESIRTVYLDTASLTSVNLAQVLLTEHGVRPEYIDDGQTMNPLKAGEARLLIGDPALREEGKYPHVFDLGSMWLELTGLPFVFAAWLVHERAQHRALNGLLQQARDEGLANLETVASQTADDFGFMPAFALDYFRHNINYDLGAPEADGIRRFAELCVRHGLIRSVPELLFHQD